MESHAETSRVDEPTNALNEAHMNDTSSTQQPLTLSQDAPAQAPSASALEVQLEEAEIKKEDLKLVSQSPQSTRVRYTVNL